MTERIASAANGRAGIETESKPTKTQVRIKAAQNTISNRSKPDKKFGPDNVFFVATGLNG